MSAHVYTEAAIDQDLDPTVPAQPLAHAELDLDLDLVIVSTPPTRTDW